EHRRPRRAEDRRELLVSGRDTRPGVDDEENEIGLVHGGARLCGHLWPERPSVLGVDTARVDQPKPGATPLAEKLLPVARHSRGLVDDGGAARGEPVDKGGLAD